MTVSSINSAIQSGFTGGVGKSELDREDFMTLFVTQLQYQDPLKPMDSYEMASQLAQFSSMEATMKMSENMEELLAYQTSQNNLQLLTLLDQKVEAAGNQFAVSGGNVGNGKFTLDERVESCIVNIYGPDGRLVKSIDRGVLDSGIHDVGWDGLDITGNTTTDGPYTFKVEAVTADGTFAEVSYNVGGTVTGIDYASGKAMLTLDNYVNVSVGDVLSVM